MNTDNENTQNIRKQKPKILTVDTNRISSEERIQQAKNISYELLITPEFRINSPKRNTIRYYDSYRPYISLITPEHSPISSSSKVDVFQVIKNIKRKPKVSVKNAGFFSKEYIPFNSDDMSTLCSPISSPGKKICGKCYKFDHIEFSCTEKIGICGICQLEGHLEAACLNEFNRIPREIVMKSVCVFCGEKGHLVCKARNLIVEDNYSSDESIRRKPSKIFLYRKEIKTVL
jgi:hypothetical protein